jgi:ankyrin repeat protein
VSILLGIGNGTFSLADDVAVGVSPFSVAVEDFNGDGKLDFAAANFNAGNVSIRLGAGDGTFISPTTSEVTVGVHPISVALGDFNSDGKPDFASANEESNNVSIRFGVGNGTFSLPTTPEIRVGVAPFSVALGDFNGDGKLDFASANRNSKNVSILLNMP